MTSIAKRKYFGTDGIRGTVGQFPITPEFAMKLGWAVGKALAHEGAKVIIGKDTRLSGYMFESALEAGFCAAGMDVYLLGPLPTPGVAYLTRTLRADLGVMITASHNPHFDNGIKFFSKAGAKLSDETEMRVEKYLEAEFKLVKPENIGKVKRIEDGPGRYIEFCKASLTPFQQLSRLKVVIDCANGATYHIAPNVLRELGAEVITINDEPDGININMQCGSTEPEALAQAVVQHEADVGVAFDGDGDRVVMSDHLGNIINGDQILYLIALDSAKRGKLNGGGVVGTLMSNLSLEQALAKKDIQFVRTQVGDRYVMEMLQQKNWHLGGEPSGHIIWLNSTTTGDGIVAALQVLALMQNTKKNLPELLEDLTLFPQLMHNIKLTKNLTKTQWQKITEEVKNVENKLQDKGRVLVRPSGTEPLIRVMVEGKNSNEVKKYVNHLASFIEKLI
jgi:phosphoglucosamine mutase